MRGQEDNEFRLGVTLRLALESVADQGDVAQDGDLALRADFLVLH
jgi:hypothetical protein